MPQSSVDLERTNDLIKSLEKEMKSLQFKLAVHSLQEILTEIPGLRSSAKVLKNSILSVEEGLNSGVIKKVAAQIDMGQAFDDFAKNYAKMTTEFSSKKPAFDETLYQAVGHDQLKVYTGSMDKIQRAITKAGVFTGYTPVLPLTSPPLDATKLKRQGIASQTFAGYTILEKQFVAGISVDFINANVPKAEALPNEKPTRKVKPTETPEKILSEFRDIILTRYAHLRLREMAQPMSWWGATWLWFATERELEIWKKCSINPTTVSSLKISKWGFPFH